MDVAAKESAAGVLKALERQRDQLRGHEGSRAELQATDRAIAYWRGRLCEPADYADAERGCS